MTLEGEARGHMAGGSGANRCPAGLRTKSGQCFRLVAKTGTNRFFNRANLFFPVIGKLLLIFLTQKSTSASNATQEESAFVQQPVSAAQHSTFQWKHAYMEYETS